MKTLPVINNNEGEHLIENNRNRLINSGELYASEFEKMYKKTLLKVHTGHIGKVLWDYKSIYRWRSLWLMSN